MKFAPKTPSSTLEYNDIRRNQVRQNAWRDGDWLHLLLGAREAFRDQQLFTGVRHIAAEDMFLGDGFTEDDWRELAAHHFWREVESLLLRYQLPTPKARFDLLLQSPMLAGLKRLDLSHADIPNIFQVLAQAEQLEELRELGLMGQLNVSLDALELLLDAPHLQTLQMLRIATSDLPEGATDLLRDFHDRTGCLVDVLGQNRDVGLQVAQRIRGGSTDALDVFMEQVREHTARCIRAQRRPHEHAETLRALIRLLDRAADIEFVTHHALPYIFSTGLEMPARYPKFGTQWPVNTAMFWRLAHGATPLAALYPMLDIRLTDEPEGHPLQYSFHGFTPGCGLRHMDLTGYSQWQAFRLITPMVTSPNLENLETISWLDYSPEHEHRERSRSAIFCELVANNPALCNLRELDLTDLGFDDASAILLANAPHLRHLERIEAMPGEDAHNPMITDVGLCALANSPLMDSLELLHIGRPGGFDCKFTQDGIDAVRAASSRNITFSRH
jgi:hypothetical protein